jgi:opacity protein-like surface antigen
MMRRFLAAAACAACAGSAQAAGDDTWTFSYTGFIDAGTGQFDPNKTLSGSFAGADANADGAITLFELDSLKLNGSEYLGCGSPPMNYAHRCEVTSFSYGIGGALTFSARWWGNDEYASSWGGSTVTGDRTTEYSYGYSASYSNTWLWSPQTRFAIAVPVPEPAAPAMLLGGLGLVALGARRRRPT